MTEPGRLRWTPARIAHIGRHGVRPSEVEEVFSRATLVEPGYMDRQLFFGPTSAGRVLALVLDPHGDGTYTPITARPANRAERRRMAHVTKGVEE